jgi:protein O-mannosyl-transferase
MAVIAVLYLPSLGSAPVFDDSLLVSGQIFAEYGNLLVVKSRALSYGSFTWLQALAPDSWAVQRAVNLLLHGATVWMMYFFYVQLLRGLQLWPDPAVSANSPDLAAANVHIATPWVLLFGVAWFALNPTAVYAVAYLVQRSIVMALLFSLVSLWALLKAMASPRGSRLGYGFGLLALIAYLAAMFSKEYALALPALAIALVVIVHRPSHGQMTLFGGLGVVVVLAAAYLLYTRFGSILGKAFDETSIAYVKQMDLRSPGVEARAYPLSVLNQMWLFFEYGCRWFLPATSMMSIDLRPPYPVSFVGAPHVLGLVGYTSVLVAGAVLMLRYTGKLALLGFCLFAPAALFVTEFSSVWIQDPFVLYRSYLWAIAVPGVIFLSASLLPKRMLIAISAVVGALFLWQATDRIQSFQSELTVWADAAQKLPPDLVIGKSRPYLNRGQAYQLQGDNTRALRDYARSTAFGDGGEGLLNTGTLLLSAGRPGEALAAFDGAKARGQNSASLALNRGSALAAVGQIQAAFDSFSAGFSLYPAPQELAALKRQRASVALRLGRVDEALADAQAASAVFNKDPEVRVTLGYAWLAKGNREAGLAAFNDSLLQSPNGPAYFGLAQIHAEASRLPEARAAIAKALRLQPENVDFQRFSAKLGGV